MLTQSSDEPDTTDARPAMVLVADDQANARDLLCAELAALGYEVVSAADGEEAWRRFCAQTPDVVITDMAMPRCDGLELLQRIRSRSDVPVIVFSGHGSIESAATAFKPSGRRLRRLVDARDDNLANLVRTAADIAITSRSRNMLFTGTVSTQRRLSVRLP